MEGLFDMENPENYRPTWMTARQLFEEIEYFYLNGVLLFRSPNKPLPKSARAMGRILTHLGLPSRSERGGQIYYKVPRWSIRTSHILISSGLFITSKGRVRAREDAIGLTAPIEEGIQLSKPAQNDDSDRDVDRSWQYDNGDDD